MFYFARCMQLVKYDVHTTRMYTIFYRILLFYYAK